MIEPQLPFGRHANPERVGIFVALLGGVYICALFREIARTPRD